MPIEGARADLERLRGRDIDLSIAVALIEPVDRRNNPQQQQARQFRLREAPRQLPGGFLT